MKTFGDTHSLFLPWSKTISHASYACREKRRNRNTFELCKAVHNPEYENIKRPIDTRTKSSIEPAHIFEVTLEPDDYTKEKFVNPCG